MRLRLLSMKSLTLYKIFKPVLWSFKNKNKLVFVTLWQRDKANYWKEIIVLNPTSRHNAFFSTLVNFFCLILYLCFLLLFVFRGGAHNHFLCRFILLCADACIWSASPFFHIIYVGYRFALLPFVNYKANTAKFSIWRFHYIVLLKIVNFVHL